MLSDQGDSGIYELSRKIIGAAVTVHRELGAGPLESAYEACLAYELEQNGIPFERQKPIPLNYKGFLLDCGYRVDLFVAKSIIVELKAVDGFQPIHQAQMLTNLRLTECKLGLLINFNVGKLTDGVKRVALNL